MSNQSQSKNKLCKFKCQVLKKRTRLIKIKIII